MKICFLLLIVFISSLAIAGEEYDFDVSKDGYLPPGRRDAYGAGIDSDATGRPFFWAPKNEPRNIPRFPDPTLRVKPDAYGPGIGSDQYGRPVEKKGWGY